MCIILGATYTISIRAFVRIATPPKLKAMVGSYISLV